MKARQRALFRILCNNMAFRHLTRRVSHIQSIGTVPMFNTQQRPISPLALGALTAGFLLLPQSTLHAEAPPEENVRFITHC